MRVVRAVLLALAALALAGSAAGHGGSATMEQAAGPYRVVYYGFVYVTEGEDLRVSFDVTEREGGAPAPVGNASLVLEEVDAGGATVGRETRHPIQSAPGFVYLDVRAGPRGLMRLDFRFDGGLNATFQQTVCAITEAGQLRCGLAGPGEASTPGAPAAAALAALAVARAAWSRRRRR